MGRSKNSRRGSNGGHATRDLVGRGAHYEPKTPENKRILRRKKRRQEKEDGDG